MKRTTVALLLWSALAVFSQLALVRTFVTLAGGAVYYANLLLLVALVTNASGFFARRFATATWGLPVLLALCFYVARWLSGFNLVDQMPAEFLWINVANVHPRPADFDLQLAIYVLASASAPLMLLIGSRQGELLVQTRSGPRAYLTAGLGGAAGAVLFALQNELLHDLLTLFVLWTALIVAALAEAMPSRRRLAYALVPLPVLLSSVASFSSGHFWSPYQRLTLVPEHDVIHVESNDFFLTTVSTVRFEDLPPEIHEWYGLALGALRDGNRVLVLGSGTGSSDVRMALHRGAGHVDAVEIDPTIISIGRLFDPDRTYDDPRVTVWNEDARRFLGREATEPYDVVYFSFLDSQALASSQGRFRLDSFLYTKEGLSLAYARLAPGGRLLINFFSGTPWIQKRMFDLVESVAPGRVSVVLHAGHPGGTLFALGRDERPQLPLSGPFRDGAQELASLPKQEIPTDDWPFLYSEERRVPLPYLRLIVGVLFLLGFVFAASTSRVRPSTSQASVPLLLYAFFSGAAFFFLELHAIGVLTPIYGSTFLTQAVVVTGVILVSLLGALAASWSTSRGRPAGWLVLAIAIASRAEAAPIFHIGTGPLGNPIVQLVLLLAPVGAAGYLYMLYLAECSGATALGMQKVNILGGALGGFCECTVIMWGFERAYWLAAAFYLAAFLAAMAATLTVRARSFEGAAQRV
ncbi:MAG: hypothetical protein U0166_18725 [Acidobacteriota bacterium]